MASRERLSPLSAEFPSSNFPQLRLSNRRPILAYDGSTSETAYWTIAVPQGITGTITLAICYAMDTNTNANTCAWDVAVEAISDGDAVDTDATTSFDSVNNSTTETNPTTAGYIKITVVTLSNVDSWAAGDYARISIARDVATDSSSGEAFLFWAELRDAA